MQLMSRSSGDRLRRHLGVLVAIAALFAAACGGAMAQTANVTVEAASAPPPAPPKLCGPASGAYKICVNPDPIATTGAPGANVTITWNLTSSGWSFVKNKGIVIKPMNAWKVPEISPTQYKATNKREGGVLYKYEINVTNGTTKLSWDPTIEN